jgi:outer membrane beta-barrel protein
MTRPFALPSLAALLAVLGSSGVAAADRVSPLEGQPAVRHKYELRSSRFEITPTFEASISAPWKNTFSGGLKLEYHITDALSLDVLGFYGTSINTGLMNQVVDSLPAAHGTDPTPSKTDAEQHANRIPIHGGAGLTLTPWFGKLSLFSRAFLAWDFYLTGGFGFAKTENDWTGDDNAVTCDAGCDTANKVYSDPRNDGPHNAGFNPGVQFGAGMHVFFSEFAALDLYVRDYMFTDNPSGLDFNHDDKVDDADRRFLSHLFVGVGIAFYLPGSAKISK